MNELIENRGFFAESLLRLIFGRLIVSAINLYFCFFGSTKPNFNQSLENDEELKGCFSSSVVLSGAESDERG